MKRLSILTISLSLLLVAVLPAAAAGKAFQEVIPLPDHFNPEGIAIGPGHTFYAGSLADGAIVAGDLRSGERYELVAGEAGRFSVGMDFDPRSGYLFVAGGPNGVGRVYDTATGELLAEYPMFSGGDYGDFINDVVVTRDAAYFTNSFAPLIYRVSLGAAGQLLDPPDVTPIELGGDWNQVPGIFVFNANGIEATPDGGTLVVVSSVGEAIFLVDPESGIASQIDLGGESVPNGDGLVLHGKTLYVVQNFMNQIGVVSLSPDLSAGSVGDDPITSKYFRVPTTAARFGNVLYAVNARFDEDTSTDPSFEIVKVSRH